MPPVVAIDTADGQDFTDTTPTLLFTGIDEHGNDVRYNIQVSDNAGFASTGTPDSYSTSNQDGTGKCGANDPGNGIYPGYAQAFDSGAGGTLDLCKFYLSKTGTPTGNATAKIYAHTGTFGTDSKPTGTALATSDVLDVSTLTGSLVEKTFNFSGANRIALTASTKYCVTIEYSGGDASNYVNVGFDENSPTHGGNMALLISGTWTENFRDAIFTVQVAGTLIDAVSGTDAGFANTVDGGDTDPFTSGQQASYTLQTALTVGITYYVRVRATDPNGSTTYGSWSPSRTIDIVSGTTFTQNLGGSITIAGALAKQAQPRKTGGITAAGALLKSVTRFLSGSVAASGALVRQDQKALAGSVSASGALTSIKASLQSLSGSVSVSGTVNKSISATKAGSIAVAAVIAKLTSKPLSGSMAASGVLAAIKLTLQSLAGSIAATSSLQRSASQTKAGSVTAVGALAKSDSKVLAGSVTPAAAIAKQANTSKAGSLSMSGAISRLTTKALTASTTIVGSAVKAVEKRLTGSTTASGTLTSVKAIFQTLAGSVTPTGSIQKQAEKTSAGSITPSGLIAKMANQVLAGQIIISGILSGTQTYFQNLVGSISASGLLRKDTSKPLTGSVATAGVLRRMISKGLSGAITTVGNFISNFIAAVVGGTDARGRVYELTRSEGRTYSLTNIRVTMTVVNAVTSDADAVQMSGSLSVVTEAKGRVYTTL